MVAKWILVVASAVIVSACSEVRTFGPDQCLRAEIFQQCLAAVPAGPQTTHYNDWSEVVQACSNTAYYQSLRSAEQIKAECRAN